ncbi:hypothetical protein APY94_02990 [Thermococcus celericrescens]|uniref:Uncharacterized protein n=1 Tax=Thermococcus celericrescens TaxID=227598 RepID=A0A100XYZ3_9EURY|nr:hypothetical protein [Thermococcus celericrescens]KUH34256.1 hypothetical protein APY94_02990 [Thermococcus celericrescens]
MSGVNLIDFVMPVATPAPEGKSEVVKRVGGFKLSLPKKKDIEPKSPAEPQRDRVEWWKLLLPIVGIIIVVKIATWYARRYGK